MAGCVPRAGSRGVSVWPVPVGDGSRAGSGKADVTGTRTLQIEKDDYSVDERGIVTRQQIEAIIPNTLFGPH